MTRIVTAILFAALFIALPAQADVLLIDAIAEEPANNAAGLQRPVNGQNMQTVRTRFGEPTSTRGPVGEPPISVWTYPGFSVYFEHDLVLNSVVHR